MKLVSKIGVYLGVFLMVMTLANPGFAQETTGTIQGTVKDATGAVVPKAAVEISSPALITPRHMDTDEAGFYRFTLLPTGVYAVTVTTTGFRQAKRTTIKLEVGRTLPIDFGLEVGAVAATVEVQATPEIVDTTSSKAGVNISDVVINNIPKGRSFTSMIVLAPGARPEPLQAGFQIDGASDGENVYAFEGMDTTHIQTGGVGVNIPLDFVQEVNIKSSGFEAEYGGALGGVVNVVSKRGGNSWHGSTFLYYSGAGLTASSRPSLRKNPDGTGLSTATRTSDDFQYYQPKEDDWRRIEPGFELNGYILKDKLWIFASYVPSFQRINRPFFVNTTTPSTIRETRHYLQTDNTHYASGRLDWQASRTIRASAAWLYAYRTWAGDLPGQDSIYQGSVPQTIQRNTAASGDPGRFRPDTGQKQPNATYTFTGEWTPTPRLVVTSRFGYWFTNTGDRGRPEGVRDVYQANAAATCITIPPVVPPATTAPPTTPSPCTLIMGAATAPITGSTIGAAGFSNIPSNLSTLFDVRTRHGLNMDGSYFIRGAGTHTIKGGYAFNRLANKVQQAFKTSVILPYWGQDFSPHLPSSTALCNTLTTTNQTANGFVPSQLTGLPATDPGFLTTQWGCRGAYGYYTIQDGVASLGNVSSYNHSLYIQDAWTVGHGVTLNLGVRFDSETLPSFSSGAIVTTGGTVVSDPIHFGFGSKFAPRLGGAWDVMNNGKLKVYGSFGYFFDIMKYDMPRGSFGGDYWHDCTYTLDSFNLSLINPIQVNGRSCPNGGGAPGTFLEEIDWRTVSNDSSDNRVDPNIKPMKQHEMIAGAEYSLRHNVGVNVRYARKRLDRTIEDNGYVDPAAGEAYIIGNPGEGLAQNLPRDRHGCATCPNQPRARREYDGIEVRVEKRWSNNWYGTAAYTWSRLFGNYSGLTSTDEAGRKAPNVSRYFDLPNMVWDSHGHPTYGPLPTDRPHTFKMYGAYRLKWWGMETTVGATQLAYSGIPITTEIATVDSGSSVMFVEGRDAFVPLTRAANGDWVAGAIQHGRRSPVYTNTDALVIHEFKLSKTNEALRASFELNVTNLFNQNTILRRQNRSVRTSFLPFGTTPAGYAQVFGGFDWVALANNPQLIPGTGATFRKLTLDSAYGAASLFQEQRSLRAKIKVSF
jgi:hypothetical protein